MKRNHLRCNSTTTTTVTTTTTTTTTITTTTTTTTTLLNTLPCSQGVLDKCLKMILLTRKIYAIILLWRNISAKMYRFS